MATNINEPWTECTIQEFRKLSEEDLYKLRYGDIEEKIEEDINIMRGILLDRHIKIDNNSMITLTLYDLLQACYEFMHLEDL